MAFTTTNGSAKAKLQPGMFARSELLTRSSLRSLTSAEHCRSQSLVHSSFFTVAESRDVPSQLTKLHRPFPHVNTVHLRYYLLPGTCLYRTCAMADTVTPALIAYQGRVRWQDIEALIEIHQWASIVIWVYLCLSMQVAYSMPQTSCSPSYRIQMLQQNKRRTLMIIPSLVLCPPTPC